MNQNINKLISGIQKTFDAHESSAFVNVGPFSEILKDNPDKAIDMIFAVYNKSLDDAYTDDGGKNVRGFIEAIAGGPHEAIPSSIYNAVGEVYSYLERSQKDKALRQVLKILDDINYFYVQISHTPYIREPLLLTDISICRRIYWPGFDDELNLIKKYSSFKRFKNETIDERGFFKRDKVKSDFILATVLMHRKYSEWGDNYIDVANPNFLNRVFNGIVAMDFSQVCQEKFDERVIEFNKIWPKRFIEKLEEIIDRKDWVDYNKFN